jgi:predicted CxxxxCH...CXXCH cytochrome family protein
MSSPKPNRPTFAWILGCAALLSGCLERRSHDDSRDTAKARCAQCHGDPERGSDYLLNSAPPRDLRGASTDSSGVGAHWIHLSASTTHAAIACSECHTVPDSVDAPGHVDTARPAEVVFGALASHDGRTPSYDAVARKCSETWCHREADAVWTQPKTSQEACGSCHGLPPPAPHPQSEKCAVCHSEVVDEARQIIAPALHVNGKVEYSSGECAQCHGSASSAAPPRDTLGQSARSAIGVGAHRAHLMGSNASRPLDCSECHHVPERLEEKTHADGLPAEVVLQGVANSQGRKATWIHSASRCSDTWCHSPGQAMQNGLSPLWTASASLDCTGCHGTPPPPPHPAATECNFCHGDVVAPDNRTIIDRDRHVDGIVDVKVGRDCTGCHGSSTPAPPRDLAGNLDPAARGVGAHQTHLLGTANSKPVPCATCHQVPSEVLAPGHLDSAAPAEVVFSGVALAHGATPTYTQGRCENTACHGAVFPDGHASGGLNTAPSWTVVDGSEAVCGSCHGLPPPRPHPYVEQSPNCSGCHQDLAPDNRSFVRPDLHIDGEVTFTVP